ncbi:Subtilisin BPN' precursor [Aquisphaera giovannonii]|uniref:Subtilisin BPN n=1 Tax=Aquisphaera giovannonii TaxID=406548 RepID=A0A5B9W6Y4_9BACT|nr:S8 family serine peptidase [Aquisphaera giovannonii]QEH36107.1 Subtilisin BPN' precursor [Aquisphaera giovannonii]
MPTHLNKIDPYLPDTFQEIQNQGADDLDIESVTDKGVVALPVVIRLAGQDEWVPPAGFEEYARVGNVASGRCTLPGLQQLNLDPRVVSVEASRHAGVEECHVSIPFLRVNQVHSAPISEEGDRALVAVIDSGIDVEHQCFLDASGVSRIVEIWDQRDPAGPAPAAIYPSLKLNYGTVHTAASIRGYATGAAALPAWLGPPVGGGADRRRHGTHVASIAAGRAAGAFAGGVAPRAGILVVIPRMTSRASIGYSSSHVEALAYIKEAASKRKLPVVVNVSLGKNAGAHDGTSPLELAFDEFSGGGRLPGLVVVKSAGNERGRNGHARLSLGSMSRDELTWDASNVARNEDVLEIWFKACDELRFRLHDPAGSPPTAWVDWSAPGTNGTFANSSNTYSLNYSRYHVDNGDSQLLVVIRRGVAPSIQPGGWKLEVESGTVYSAGQLDAWVERDDSRAIAFTSHLNEEMTLSIPGSARCVIAVGAVNSVLPSTNTRSSSYGRTRDLREKPDVVAPGEAIMAAEAGNPTGAIAMTGTSMAAPHVAGMVALLLSRVSKKPGSPTLPNAAQVRAALTQLTQHYSGQFTVSRGYGLPDAEKFVKAFD